MTNADMAPAGEQDPDQDGRGDVDQPRYTQLRGDVDDAYDILRKNSKTLKQHTKTLAKHGTSLRWIKRAQADHTVRLQRIETKLGAVDTRFDGVERQLAELQSQIRSVIGLLGGKTNG
ncbi:MAG: hypothetical protein ACRC20_14440 [Segniliparus sp.]|uniref:hypothetical protein n=1 Tax=Segniliparus sp. TaxID=2804064 RepID=UPI003F33946D